MAFLRRSRHGDEPDQGSLPGRWALALVRITFRVAFGAVVIAALVVSVLYLRLTQGPIHLGWAASAAARMFNEGTDELTVAVGDMIVNLGEGGDPSGIQFADVTVRNAGGTPLFSVSRLAASFAAADLLSGEVRPNRITLIRPEATLTRLADGRFRFGVGGSADDDLGGGPPLVNDAPQVAAIGRLLDGLAGDAEILPELAQLREISIVDAKLTYRDAVTERRWTTRQADLRLIRIDTGLQGRLEIGLEDGAVPGVRVIIDAERRRGAGGASQVAVRFENLRPEHLAEQLAAMEWLRLFDAPLDGDLQFTVHADGRIEGLAGRIAAGPGQILALDAGGKPIERATLEFAYERERERMQVSALSLVSPALDARLSGFVDLRRGPGGAMTGLAGQFEVAAMRVAVPEMFADPLAFDGGQIVARLALNPARIDVAEAHLRNGNLVFDLTGRAWVEAGHWHTDVRAGGRNLTVAQLVQHWPLVAATNARRWVVTNIRAGNVDEMVALMRFDGAEAALNLDFTYSGLESTYLRAMTPIRHARGRGSLTLDEFHLEMDAGQVEPIEGAPVMLDGSVVHMRDLQGAVTPADLIIRARGRTDSVLTLIDEEPLGFIRKLGLDASRVGGEVTVTAQVGFPLLNDLELEQIEATAVADLVGLKLPFVLPGGHVADVAGDEVELRAGMTGMRLAGPLTVDGVPLALDWNEHYGRGANHRTIAIAGSVTPALLARFGIEADAFRDGSMPVSLDIAQEGAPGYEFNLQGDLGPARIAVAELGWLKPPGAKGTLEASGHYRDGIRLAAIHLDTEELKVEGAVDLTPDGGLRSARLDRVQYRDLADVELTVAPDPHGGMAATLGGRRLDLALLDELPAAGGGTRTEEPAARPLNVDFRVDELVLSSRLTARPAAGTYHRNEARDVAVELGGQADGRVPFIADYQQSGAEPGRLELTSSDAGALLGAAGLFRGAHGGRLRLKARIPLGEGSGAIAGIARISDVTIRSAGTFKAILDEGGAKEAANAAETGGIFFDKIKVPFVHQEGVLTLDDATAKGVLLGVTLEGTVDENQQEVDLIGVISPAYALTGLLDEIPVIGDILTGGKGEGIFGMTFAVKGPMEEPRFSVNPLSLLTPGILRKIFSGRTARPDDRFLEQLKRDLD